MDRAAFTDKMENDKQFSSGFNALSTADRSVILDRVNAVDAAKPATQDLTEQSSSMTIGLTNPFAQLGNTDGMIQASKNIFNKGVESVKALEEGALVNPMMTGKRTDIAKGALQASISFVGAFGSAIESEARTMSSQETMVDSLGRLAVWGTDAPTSQKIRETLPVIMRKIPAIEYDRQLIGKYTNIDDMVADAGKLVQDMANTALEFKPYAPENKLVGDIGGGMASMGLAILSKNPALASTMFGAITKGQTWQELKTKDWSDQEALAVADLSAIVTVASEYASLDFIMNKVNGSNALYTGGISAISEFVQEFIENKAIGNLSKIVGASDKSWEAITKEALYSGFIATFSGGGFGAFKSMMNTSNMSTRLKDLGVPADKVDTAIKGLFSASKKHREDALVTVYNETIGKTLEDAKPAIPVADEVAEFNEITKEPVDIKISDEVKDDVKAEAEIVTKLKAVTELINATNSDAPSSLVKQRDAMVEVLEGLVNEDNTVDKDIKKKIKKATTTEKSKVELTEQQLLSLVLRAQSKGATVGQKAALVKFNEKMAEVKAEKVKGLKIKAVKKIIDRAVKSKNIDPVYQQVLSNIGKQQKQSERAKKAEQIRELYEQAEAEGFDVVVPEKALSDYGSIDMENMTVEQVDALYAIVTKMNKLGRMKNKLLTGKATDTLDSVTTDIEQSIVDSGVDINEQLTKQERVKKGLDKPNKLGEILQGIDMALSKLEFMAQKLDGDVQEGAAWRALYQPLYDASNAQFIIHNNDMANIKNNIEKNGITADVINKKHEVAGESYTTEQIMAMYANSKNADNTNRLLEGHDITEAQMNEAIGKLSSKEKAFVDEVISIIQAKGELLQGVSYEVEGEIMDLVENYFPIVYKGSVETKAKSASDFDYMKNTIGLGQGFKKKRTEGTGQPLNLDFMHVAINHIEKVNHYVTHAAAIQDIKRVLAQDTTQGAIKAALGKDAVQVLRDHIKNVANPSGQFSSFTGQKATRFLEAMKNNVTAAVLGLNPVTAMVQFLSYGQTVNELGVAASSRGLNEFIADMGPILDFMRANSAQMENRDQSLDREIRDAWNAMQAQKLLQGKTHTKDLFFALIKGVDNFTVGATWWSAFQEKMDETEGNKEASISYADRIVRTTQPMMTAKDMPAIAQKGSGLRFLVSFYSAFSTTYNILSKTGRRLRVGSDDWKKKLATAFQTLLLTIIAPALTGEFIKSAGQAELKDYAIAPAKFLGATVPFLGSALYAATSFGGSSFPFMKAIEAPIKGAVDTSKVGLKSLKDGQLSLRDAGKIAKSTVDAIGYSTGMLPANTIGKAIMGAIDLQEGKTTNPLRLFITKHALRENKKKKIKRSNF